MSPNFEPASASWISWIWKIPGHLEAHPGLATWANAVCTLLAVGTALWLGVRTPKPRVTLEAFFRKQPVGRDQFRQSFVFRVRNQGAVQQTVAGLTYSIGWWRWRTVTPLGIPAPTRAADLPYRIDPGGMFDVEARERNYLKLIEALQRDTQSRRSIITRRRFRFTAHLASGHSVSCKPPPEFWRALCEQLSVAPAEAQDRDASSYPPT